MGDYSSRFLEYTLKHVPGSWSYHTKGPFIAPSKVFHFTCITTGDFYDALSKRYVGEAAPLSMAAKLPRKKIVPPQWTHTQVQEITAKLKDRSIKFIIFPLVLERKESGCSNSLKKTDTKKHCLLCVYNKKADILEIWDDGMGHVQTDFEWKELVNSLIKTMVVPVLQTFGVGDIQVAIPMFPETKYSTFTDSLAKAGHSADFANAYSMFLVNYTHYRSKHSMQGMATACRQCVKYDSKLYDLYIQFCSEWQLKNGCKEVDHVRNMETGVCVDAKGVKGQEVQELTPPCDNNEVYNLQKCVKLDSMFLTRKTDLNRHVEHTNPRDLVKFLIAKHPYCAMILPSKRMSSNHEFIWTWAADRRPHWKLAPPYNFDKFMRAVLKDSKVRFAVFMIYLSDKFGGAHANALILDKKNRTVERYEPNAPIFHNDLGNNHRLDEAAAVYFKKYNFDFIPAIQACPIGFHRVEWEENTANVRDFGGNCVLWTLWYVHMRLTYPDIERASLTKYALQELKKKGSLKHFINGFHAWLLKGVRNVRKRVAPL